MYDQMLRKNFLFSDLSDEELEELLKISHKIVVNQDIYFIREGDVAEDFYFILDGSICVTKLDKKNEYEHIIAYLEPGESVGEIALLDREARSASAKAVVRSELLRFPFQALKKLAMKMPSLNKVLVRITEKISKRMRLTNIAVVSALEKQLNESKMRVGLGMFLINVVSSLCFLAYFLSWISAHDVNAIASTVITAPLTLFFLIFFFLIMKSSKLPLRTFGLTTHNWYKAIMESIIFTVILCVLVTLIKWIMIHTMQKYIGRPLFEPYISIHLSQSFHGMTKQNIWWVILAIYWFVVTPLQELIARGGLQGPLEVFFPEKYGTLKAILVSNLIFSVGHLFLGIPISLLVFLAGLYFGWLYSRHKTLIGVILAHAILGTWVTMVVGF